MKIHKIQFAGHPILGDLALDFSSNGRLHDNIIFAGENGCGKTTLLKFIQTFSNNLSQHIHTHPNYTFKVEFILSAKEIAELSPVLSQNSIQINNQTMAGILFIEYIHNRASTHTPYTVNSNIPVQPTIYSATAVSCFQQCLASIYSSVDINFTPASITQVSAKELDRNIQQIKSTRNNNLATDIKQMLIDIYNQDANDLATWCRANSCSAPSEDVISKRISRFSRAFDNMFDNLRFKEVITSGGKIDVIFSKNRKDISIDDLSSGEKQIVFRGGDILRDINSTNG